MASVKSVKKPANRPSGNSTGVPASVVDGNKAVAAPQPEEQAAPASPNAPAGVLTQADPGMSMGFPGVDENDVDAAQDMPSPKDHLLNDHQMRIGNKRRFLMDALCRALDTDMYLLEVDKEWAPNPLGRGGNVNVRYSREFPTIYVMFDKFMLDPGEQVIQLKRQLAHSHGFKYIYETPGTVLSHEELTRQLGEQKHVVHPEVKALAAMRQGC